ncbi:SsgA family sporulation/cell division regulator [Streptomyces sp. NPDC060209]|uniref:SsgA family sporulation/cell division regulator n=1 Tax=Streptomyces sp. NPDC060209 TaxID=3347073 RepID=UPI0036616D6A
MSREVRAVTRGVLEAAGAVTIPCDVGLRYTRDDPCAVTLTLWGASLVEEHWCVSRDLLDAGLRAGSGAGAVHVRPGTPAGSGRPGVSVTMRSAARTVELSLDHWAMSHYLERTCRIVPMGEEFGPDSMNAVIDRLLSDGGEPSAHGRR